MGFDIKSLRARMKKELNKEKATLAKLTQQRKQARMRLKHQRIKAKAMQRRGIAMRRAQKARMKRYK